MKSKQKSTTLFKAVNLIVIFGLFTAFFSPSFSNFIFKLSKPSQLIYSLVCASVCFLAVYISKRRGSDKINPISKMISYLPWIGWGEIVLAIFLALVNIDTKMGHWGILINHLLSFIVLLYGYIFIITSLFPQTIQEIQTQSQVQDPLEDLPQDLREIMHDGRFSIGMAVISTLAVFIIIVVVSIIFIGGMESPLPVIAIEICTVIFIGIIVRYFAVRKWQKQAMQLGIPEKKLGSAAKLAGLPWPKIKEE